MATTKYREAENEVAKLRQKPLLLGLSSQRINALKSVSQVNSEVAVPAPTSTDKPNEFVMRPVRLGPESNGFYPVFEGLNTGDRIVTEGGFLRAEWLKSHPAK